MKLHLEQIKSAADNISRYYKTEVSLGERMSANFGEIASFVASAAAKDVKQAGFFHEDSPLAPYMPHIDEESENLDTLPENKRLCGIKLAIDSGAHLADFCAKVTSSLKENTRFKPSPALFKKGTLPKLNAGKVSFADSRVFTAAFEEFRKKDSSLTPSYVRSFADACEDVSSESSDFCILPIENNREGALLSVYRLIERYELFIMRVCIIESDDLTTKFALLCRENHGIIDINTKQHIDIRLSGNDPSLMPKIYTAAAVLGIDAIKTVSVPLGYTDGYAHISTFYSSGEALFAFLLFLATVRADYTLMGIYE